VDGSGWDGVYRSLKKDGYTVTIVQNATISLADDMVRKRLRVIQHYEHRDGFRAIVCARRPEGHAKSIHSMR
jgi:hypothetical protein